MPRVPISLSIMKRASLLFTLIAALAAFALSGCETTAPTSATASGTSTTDIPANTSGNTSGNSTVATTSSDELPAPPQSDNSDVVFQTNQLVVVKTVEKAGQVGEEVHYRIHLQALRAVKNVRVTETLPEQVAYVSASPEAQGAGSHHSWQFGAIDAGDSRQIDVIVKPLAEGNYTIDSTISVDNNYGINFFAGQPKLEVEKTGPEMIELGEQGTWVVTVTNNGSAPATNITVTDNLPASLEVVGEPTLSIDQLSKGESAEVSFTARAIKKGDFVNKAIVSYEGGPKIAGEGDSPFKIVQSGLRVRKIGPTEAYVFKPTEFQISIENTGDTDLTNVRITDILPKGASISNNGGGRVSGDAIGWMIPELPAGTSQLITTQYAATLKGSASNTAKVLSATGLEASDTLETNWLAVPGVTISMRDRKDPIQIGEQTVLDITILNQGRFEPVSGTLTVSFTKGRLKPVGVGGSAKGVINGQTVTFPTTTLEAGKDIDLEITVEAVALGAGRAKLSFDADFLEEPILSQEATNVY